MKASHIGERTQALWAKKSREAEPGWLPLITHLEDTAAVAKLLWNKWLPEAARRCILADTGDEACALGTLLFLSLTHDIGKATPAFQLKSSGNADTDDILRLNACSVGIEFGGMPASRGFRSIPHALASQQILEQSGCDRSISVVAGSHHGKPPSFDIINSITPQTYPDSFGSRLPCWQPIWDEIICHALHAGCFRDIHDLPQISQPVQVLLCALVIMADWLASNTACFPYIPLNAPAPDSDARVRRGLRSLPLPYTAPPGNSWTDAAFFRTRFGFDPYPLQAEAIKLAAQLTEPGIIVLEAAMGSGKTEAALAAAEILSNRFGLNGIFFALPTQSTSNAIFSRILDWTRSLGLSGRHSINLAHGKAQFNKDFTALFEGGSNVDDNSNEVESWFEGNKKALLADYVVGTIDQLLFAALRQKHVMLRHLGLAGKVVILDECHAYDAYMNQYLFRALRWLGAYHVPVIVLSATLPGAKREALMREYTGKPAGRRPRDPLLGPAAEASVATDLRYPLITYSQGATFNSVSLITDSTVREVETATIHESDLTALIARYAPHPGCIGIIVNTVARAQALAHQLEDQYGRETVTLLHSNYLPEDRAATESALVHALGRNGAPRTAFRIVVGTQVLEQSLDINFDLLLTDLCPMDLLLQRIGRLHRHTIRRDPAYAHARCYVMLSDADSYDDGSRAVYGDYLLLRTYELLPERIRIPESIPDLVHTVYDTPPVSDACRAAYETYLLTLRKKEERARSFRITSPARGETLVGWLDTDVEGIETRAQAAVRDIDPSVEVILVWTRGEHFFFPPWIEGGREIPYDLRKAPETAKAVARLTMTLPRALCGGRLEPVIRALEERTSAHFAEWQLSPWLKGALILPLNEAGEAELCGFLLKYDHHYGMTCTAQSTTPMEKEKMHDG